MTVDAFMSWGGETALAVTLLVGLILLIRRPFSKYFGAKAAYALWALPVFRLFMPPLELAWLSPLKEALPQPWPQTSEVFVPQNLFNTIQSKAAPSLWESYGMTILCFIWVVGGVVFLIWHLHLQRKTFGHWLMGAKTPPRSLIEMSADISDRVGMTSPPSLSLSEHISGPLVTGLRQPHIILPLDFAETFTSEEQYYVLLHEITHIRRRDLYTSTLALLMRALNWPNPLVHLAARYFRADQEAACDASVLDYISSKQSAVTPYSHAYAQTLIKAAVQAQTQISSGLTAPALALTIHHPLKERLMTLSNPMPKPSLRHRLVAIAISATVLTVNAPISFVAASEEPQTELAGKVTTPVPSRSPYVEIEKEVQTINGETYTHLIDFEGLETQINKTIADAHAKTDFDNLYRLARLQAAESMLESVLPILGDCDDASGAHKELQDAMKAIEQARIKIAKEQKKHSKKS